MREGSRAVWGVALGTAALLLVMAFVLSVPGSTLREVSLLQHRLWERVRGPSALVLSDGRAFERLEGGPATPVAVSLSDGSRIEAEPGARVEALSSTARELALVVRRGRVRFSVTPGGPRRWSIEARGTTVEVVGTVLSVEASEQAVRVAVEIGTVVVRSLSLPDGVQRLDAGGSLILPNVRESAPAESSPAEPAPAGREPAESSPELGASYAGSAVKPSATSAVPRMRATAPTTSTAPVSTAPARARTAAASEVRELWSRADAARRARDPRGASELLERLLREHPSDPRAALAAFTRGTLLAEELGRPREAAVALRRALDLGLPAALRDACFLRLASALRDARDAAGVRAVATGYALAYPRGERRSDLEALASEAERGAERAASAPPPLSR